MTTIARIDAFLERWRASVAPPITPDDVDDFIRRHRAAVEPRIAQTLARVRAGGGERPETPADFLAYDALVARERHLDAQPDRQVLDLLLRRVNAQFAAGGREWEVLGNFAVEYIDARTEAMLLRDADLDAVPMLLKRPALVIVEADHVVAVRDWRGVLSVHPERSATQGHLRADLQPAEERLLELRDVLGIDPNTIQRLVQYALAMWTHAREARAQRG